MRMRRVHLSMRTEGIKAFSNGYGVVVWTGENDTKTISVDAKLFENLLLTHALVVVAVVVFLSSLFILQRQERNKSKDQDLVSVALTSPSFSRLISHQ